VLHVPLANSLILIALRTNGMPKRGKISPNMLETNSRRMRAVGEEGADVRIHRVPVIEADVMIATVAAQHADGIGPHDAVAPVPPGTKGSCSGFTISNQVHVEGFVPVALEQPTKHPTQPIVAFDVVRGVIEARRPHPALARLVPRRVVRHVLAGFREGHRASATCAKDKDIHRRSRVCNMAWEHANEERSR